MADHTVLYLLRRPSSDSCSLLKAGESGSHRASLVLLEEAAAAPPGFSGAVYRLENRSAPRENGSGAQAISYRQLLDLIAQHDRTIVL